MSPPLFVITGQLSAGKSTVARALLGRYPLGFHIDVDGIREMVVSGMASPLEWTDETTRQFDLALAGSASLAAVYHGGGFAVAIEGGVDPDAVDRELEGVGLLEHRVGVVLHPPLQVALERNRSRRNKPFDTSILEEVMHRIDADIAARPLPAGWFRVDNSGQSVDETVGRILSFAQ